MILKKELKNHKVLSANIVEKDLELILPEVCMSKHLMAKNMPKVLSKMKMETVKWNQTNILLIQQGENQKSKNLMRYSLHKL